MSKRLKREQQPTVRFYVKPEIKEGLLKISRETGVSLQFIFEKYAEEFLEGRGFKNGE